jgi:hypothetical protein
MIVSVPHSAGNSANPAAGVGAQSICVAGDADKVIFTVPAWVLSALPASGFATDIPAPVDVRTRRTGPPGLFDLKRQRYGGCY